MNELRIKNKENSTRTYATLPIALTQNQYHVGMGWGDT